MLSAEHKKILISCISTNHDENLDFNVDRFFGKWFYEEGKPYAIFFKKNLEITNLQYAELYPLIRQYTSETDLFCTESSHTDVMFHNSEEFKHTIERLVYSYINSAKSLDEINWEIFYEAYESLLSLGVILDQRFGSCSLLMPPSLSIEINQVCAQSGYIDSCGLQIYVRHIEKAKSNEVSNSVEQYIEKRESRRVEKKFPKLIEIATWSHEEYRESHGALDHLKLHEAKVRISNIKISDLVKKLVADYPDTLIHPPKSPEANDKNTVDGAIWIMRDREIVRLENTSPMAGRKWYIIIYHQIYKNCNPLHIFDENKPAWIAPVTIPHSLLGAMMNLTRPWNSGEVRLHDPFCGSGALILEAFKDPRIYASGSDISPFSRLMLKHNLNYLSTSGDGLSELSNFLKNQLLPYSHGLEEKFLKPDVMPDITQAKKLIHSPIGGVSTNSIQEKSRHFIYSALVLIRELYEQSKFVSNPHSYNFEQGFVAKVELLTIEGSLVFYLLLRAALRTLGRRGTDETFDSALKASGEELIDLLERYRKWATRDSISNHNTYPKLPREMVGSRHFQFHYYEVGIDHKLLIKKNHQQSVFDSLTVTSAIEDGYLKKISDRSVTGVVTDPPYGFNTDEKTDDLIYLYSQFLNKWMPKIANKGHLVLCLPEETYNGQSLPFCTSPSLITSQVLAVAAKQRRKVIVPARSKASNSTGFYPPYYWQSTKVLRRLVIHFVIDE